MFGLFEMTAHLFDICRSSAPDSSASAARASLSRGSRLKSKTLIGNWKAFDLTAVPIDETDPSTGAAPLKAMRTRSCTDAVHCQAVSICN